MGTNYYLYCRLKNKEYKESRNVGCPNLVTGGTRQAPEILPKGVHYERIHIGKRSAGWVFLLGYHSDRGICCLEDYTPLLFDPSNLILDEYGRSVSPTKRRAIIRGLGHEGKGFDRHREVMNGLCPFCNENNFDSTYNEFE